MGGDVPPLPTDVPQGEDVAARRGLRMCGLCGRPIVPGQPVMTQFGRSVHRSCGDATPQPMWGA